VIVSVILVSDHLPIVFHILDHVKTKILSEPVEKVTDWEMFQSLASHLILPRIEISSEEEADKEASDFTAFIASAYRLSISEVTFSDINNLELPGVDSLLKHKQRLWKLWKETRDPASKTAVNCIKKTIRRMARRQVLGRWETKIGNCRVTSQAIWSIVKSLIKEDGPKAPLGLKYQPIEKANTIADCLENHFTPHDLCDETHERRVEARV
jgi:hypothetical protein